MNQINVEILHYFVSYQNEKLHLLVDCEKEKLTALDEEHMMELKEWNDRLTSRKEVNVERRDTAFGLEIAAGSHFKPPICHS